MKFEYFLMNKSSLNTEDRLQALIELGEVLRQGDEHLDHLIQTAVGYNPWFTAAFTKKATDALAEMLKADAMRSWNAQWAHYPVVHNPKKIGLILAGNIPMVGFHDVLCVLAAGHIALIKCSSQDNKLLPYVLNKLCSIEPAFEEQIKYTEKLENFDAVIATGSNNSSRYFEYYFGKVPHIIRKNRNSVAILRGDESKADLHALGTDIFDYFGLGCRNVSKLMVPEGYDFRSFFEAIESFGEISQHHKYHNNYDYHKSIFLVNGEEHLDNGFLLLKKDTKLASPLAVLHYENYANQAELSDKLLNKAAEIQCIASMHPIESANQIVPFGSTQQPRLWDYADGINLMQFLLKELDTIPGK